MASGLLAAALAPFLITVARNYTLVYILGIRGEDASAGSEEEEEEDAIKDD